MPHPFNHGDRVIVTETHTHGIRFPAGLTGVVSSTSIFPANANDIPVRNAPYPHPNFDHSAEWFIPAQYLRLLEEEPMFINQRVRVTTSSGSYYGVGDIATIVEIRRNECLIDLDYPQNPPRRINGHRGGPQWWIDIANIEPYPLQPGERIIALNSNPFWSRGDFGIVINPADHELPNVDNLLFVDFDQPENRQVNRESSHIPDTAIWAVMPQDIRYAPHITRARRGDDLVIVTHPESNFGYDRGDRGVLITPNEFNPNVRIGNENHYLFRREFTILHPRDNISPTQNPERSPNTFEVGRLVQLNESQEIGVITSPCSCGAWNVQVGNDNGTRHIFNSDLTLITPTEEQTMPATSFNPGDLIEVRTSNGFRPGDRGILIERRNDGMWFADFSNQPGNSPCNWDPHNRGNGVFVVYEGQMNRVGQTSFTPAKIAHLLKKVRDDEYKLTQHEAAALTGWLRSQQRLDGDRATQYWLRDQTDVSWFLCDESNHYYPTYQEAATPYRGDVAIPAIRQQGWTNCVISDDERDGWCREDDAEWFRGTAYYRPYLDEWTDHCSVCGDRYNPRVESQCCDEEEDDTGEYSHSYSTNILVVNGNKMMVDGKLIRFYPKKLRLYGVELETETQRGWGFNDIVWAIKDNMDDDINRTFILKSDGSVSGPEIVTLPMDYMSHKKHFPWKDLLEAARLKGRGQYKDDKPVGMHIHVNKASMSQLTIGKLLVFMNAPKNRSFVETVAQRSANSYTKYFPKKLHKERLYSQDHYDAVSLSSKGTIEIRVFRSSLRYDRVMKNLEFVESLLNYLEQCSVRALTYREYTLWLSGRRKTYPHLTNFLVESEYMTKDKEVKYHINLVTGETKAA